MDLLLKSRHSNLFIKGRDLFNEGGGIALRLILLILLSTTIIFFCIFWYYYTFSREVIVKKIEEDTTHLAQATANRIDKVLATTQKIPDDLALFLEHCPQKTDDLQSLMAAFLENNPEIYGVALAFEPYAYNPSLKTFAPYYYRSKGKVASSEIPYEYFTWDWYQIPRELGRGAWIEPYFDEGAGEIIMSTYAVPFYQELKGQRVLKGIVTVDISLSWLKDIVSGIKIGKTGYGCLISKNGTFVTHPHTSLIMNESIFSVAEERSDNTLRDIGRAMISGKSGFTQTEDLVSGETRWMAYAPLSSSGWSLAVIFPQKELMTEITRLNEKVLLLGVTGLIFLIIVIIWISRSITGPLRALTGAAVTMAQGNLDAPLPRIKSRDETGMLTESFNTMKDSLKKYISDLTEATAAKERIESELRLAHDIQMGIIPRIFPAFPNNPEFDIFAILRPAREVGGDLYDFFFMDHNHLCFTIGDVSGKGIPASLFMAVTRMLIKAKAVKGLAPETILARVNEDLCLDNPSMMFVTLFLGILDIRSGEMLYCNGGHNPPYILHAAGGMTRIEGPKGMALGVMGDFVYHSGKLILKNKDKIFLYTDGVTEAANDHDELYSDKRMEMELSALSDCTLKEIIAGIMERIDAFSREVPQTDDITMMVLEFCKDCSDKLIGE